MRWKLFIQEFDPEIAYIKGAENCVDCLFRDVLQLSITSEPYRLHLHRPLGHNNTHNKEIPVCYELI